VEWKTNLLDTSKGLQRFYETCSAAGPSGCGFYAPTPEDIERNLTALFASIRSNPIPAKIDNMYGIIDYLALRTVVFSALFSPYALWPALADGLAALAAGDGTKILPLAIPPRFECDCMGAIPPMRTEAETAILCNDGAVIPGTVEDTVKYLDELRDVSEWWDLWGNMRTTCSRVSFRHLSWCHCN
jgi:hypothetical protein